MFSSSLGFLNVETDSVIASPPRRHRHRRPRSPRTDMPSISSSSSSSSINSHTPLHLQRTSTRGIVPRPRASMPPSSIRDHNLPLPRPGILPLLAVPKPNSSVTISDDDEGSVMILDPSSPPPLEPCQ